MADLLVFQFAAKLRLGSITSMWAARICFNTGPLVSCFEPFERHVTERVVRCRSARFYDQRMFGNQRQARPSRVVCILTADTAVEHDHKLARFPQCRV